MERYNYIPFLNHSLGELKALESLQAEQKHRIKPLFRFNKDTDSIRYKESCFVLINKYSSKLKLDQNQTPVYQTKTPPSTPKTKCGVFISIEEIARVKSKKDAENLVRKVSSSPEVVFLELKGLTEKASMLSLLEIPLNCFLELDQKVCILGTVEPASMGDVQVRLEKRDRLEWTLFRSLGRKHPHLIYGDYATRHPDAVTPGEEWTPFKEPSAKIRYTADKELVILKGKSLRRNGYEQFHDLSKQLTEMKEFKDPTFSYGDERIDKCAQKLITTGNQTTWITNETSHHICLVLHQLKELSRDIA